MNTATSFRITAGWMLCLALAAPCVQAQDANAGRSALPALDPQVAAQFPAVGRIGKNSLVDRQGCTATLITPTLVVTAAHCAAQDGTSNSEFFAGWTDGDYAAVRSTFLEIRHPAYAVGGQHRPQNDLALIVLASPIENVTPLPLIPQSIDVPVRADLGSDDTASDDGSGSALDSTQVALLGYHRHSPDRLSGRFDCPVSYFAEGLFVVGCPVANGNSGSPILKQTEDGAWQVVGVVSSTIPGAAVAVDVSDWLRREVAAQGSD